MLQLFLLSCCIFGVLELHRRFRLYCGLEKIHRIIDGLICGLGFAFHVQTALELLCLMRTCKSRDLLNESHTLAFGDELGCLHRIHDHLQLGKFQRSAANEVLVLSALVADDIKAAVLEIHEIRGNRLSIGVDTTALQVSEDVCDDCRMFFVRVIPQIFQYV